MALDWTKTGKELDEYLDSLTERDLKRIIRDFSLYAEKEKLEYINAKLLYEKNNAELKDKYRKQLNDLIEFGKATLKREDKAFHKSLFWEGKFNIVKAENNKLRNKLYRKEKESNG